MNTQFAVGLAKVFPARNSTIEIGDDMTVHKPVFPQASPSCTLKQRVGVTNITIEYGRPGVKGRTIFGDLVPYGKVWRTGANAVTKITFSSAVIIDKQEIAAGTYALLAIPEKDSWTLILNKDSEQWGAYKYDQNQDVVRVKATPSLLTDAVENFTIEFADFTDDSANLQLIWDRIKVSLPLQFNYYDKLAEDIEKHMNSDDADKQYFSSASFFFYHNRDLNKAKTWCEQALAARDAFFINHLYAQILDKLGDKAGAKAACEKSLEQAKKIGEVGFINKNEKLLATLK